MNICFLMATPFTLGGEQRVVTIISNLLVKEGNTVTILCTDEETPINYSTYQMNKKVKIKFIDGYNSIKAKKIREKRLKMERDSVIHGKYKNSLRKLKYIHCDRYTAKLLIKTIKENKFDYVISLSTTYNTMLAVISSKIKAKTIGWQHNCCKRYFDTMGVRHYNQDKFTKYMFKQLDAYVVLTNKDKEYIKNRFHVDSIVINNPKSILSKKVSKLDQKKFLAVGRLVAIKNFETLIDMFNKFHKKNKEWSLSIVGEGELREILEQKVKEYKLEKYVKIEKYTNKVSDYYLNSSCYLMTSLSEGWPMVLGEALEFGLPIISFGITAAPEIIKNGYNGYIVEDYNENVFIKKMLKIAENKELLNKLGHNSKEKANRMINENIAKQWINLMNDL